MVVSKLVRIPSKTEAANTAITFMVSPKANYLLATVSRLTITAVTTAQVVTVMNPLGRTTLSAGAAAAQKVINITADPGSIAANDYLAIQNTDGTWFYDIVASVATLAITMTANVVTALLSAAKVLFYGIPADTGHEDQAAPVGETTWSDDDAYWIADRHGEPIIIWTGNVTTAATFEGGISKLYTG